MAFSRKDQYAFHLNVTCIFNNELMHSYIVNPKYMTDKIFLVCPHCGMEFCVGLVDYVLDDSYYLSNHLTKFYGPADD